MKRVTFCYLTLVLVISPIMTALADCPETPNGTHLWLGVDTTIPTSRNWPNRPHISELDLLRLSVVWVPDDPESRYRDQHFIGIDWVNRTHTNVGIWDGELQAVRDMDVYPVTLPMDTNFETGQIHIETCAIYNPAGPLLLFAYYGFDGMILETRVSSGMVTNQLESNIISDNFNYGLADRMIDDVERATGVRPEHYLAESFLFQNLTPSVRFLDKFPTKFFGAENATVMQSRVYVTGNESSALLPYSLSGVFSDGINIMDGDYRVRNLEQYLGVVLFQKRRAEIPDSYNLIIDVRPELKIENAPCVDGHSTLTAEFVYPSELDSDIRLWLGDSRTTMTNPMIKKKALNEWISCDYDYRVEGRRFLEGIRQQTSSGEIWVPVATKDTLIRIQYDAHYDGAAPRMTSPSIETVLKVWGKESIESLYGRHVYFCDKAGDERVDSVDEIAARRTSLLTAEEKLSFDPFTDEDKNQRAWQDGEGDGTMCNFEELWSGDGQVIRNLTLSVYPPGD
jgi:hypothetical protein